MSLAEHLSAPKNKSCKVARVLAELDAGDREVLLTALADVDGYSSRRIARALHAEGLDVGHTTLQEHRIGACCCGTR